MSDGKTHLRSRLVPRYIQPHLTMALCLGTTYLYSPICLPPPITVFLHLIPSLISPLPSVQHVLTNNCPRVSITGSPILLSGKIWQTRKYGHKKCGNNYIIMDEEKMNESDLSFITIPRQVSARREKKINNRSSYFLTHLSGTHLDWQLVKY